MNAVTELTKKLSVNCISHYFYRCTVHLEDSLSIKPTNAFVGVILSAYLIVYENCSRTVENTALLTMI